MNLISFFLDIELPGGSGFELLENLPKRNFEIIFTTVFDQYAIRGYEFAALDYLIKPIEPLKLRSSIDRLKEESEVSPDSLNHRLQLLSENLNSLNFYSKKIFISLREKMVSVTLADINYIEGDNNKVHVRLINGQSFNHSKTLKYYEKDLFLGSEDKFFRINKSIIINVLGVKEYLTDGTVILPDQIPLFVSPKYRRGLVSILKSFPR